MHHHLDDPQGVVLDQALAEQRRGLIVNVVVAEVQLLDGGVAFHGLAQRLGLTAAKTVLGQQELLDAEVLLGGKAKREQVRDGRGEGKHHWKLAGGDASPSHSARRSEPRRHP